MYFDVAQMFTETEIAEEKKYQWQALQKTRTALYLLDFWTRQKWAIDRLLLLPAEETLNPHPSFRLSPENTPERMTEITETIAEYVHQLVMPDHVPELLEELEQLRQKQEAAANE